MANDALGNQWYQPTAGISSVGSYQTSGIPWASSSIPAPSSGSTPTEVSFPQVTKFIVVKNLTSNLLRVGFSQNGVNGTNYFVLGNLESFAADIRITKLYLLSNSASTTSASIVAGLTGIAAGNLENNWSGSAGVG